MAVRRFLLRSHSMRSRIDHFEPVTYALPHTKINPGKTDLYSTPQILRNHLPSNVMPRPLEWGDFCSKPMTRVENIQLPLCQPN